MGLRVYKKIFFGLFLLFAVLALYFTANFPTHKKGKSIDVQSFQNVLYQKESVADGVLGDLIHRIKLHKYQLINNVMFFDTTFEQSSDNDIYYAIYSYDTLCFWTDNHLILPELIDNRFNSSINKIGNSWYEIRRREFGNYIALGFIKIKDEYPYTNRYLRDHFAKGFDFLGSQVNISLIPVSYGYDVKSSDGQYIFSLVPVGVRPEDKGGHNNLTLIFFILSVWFFFGYLILAFRNAKAISIIIVYTLWLALRIYMLLTHSPGLIYSNPFFSPLISFYSLGDLLIDIPLVLSGLAIFSIRFDYEKYRPEENYIVFDLVFLFIVNLLIISGLYFVYDLFNNLIISTNLSFELYKIYTLSIGSIVVILILGLIIAAFLAFYYLMFKIIARYFTLQFLLISQAAIVIVLYLINVTFVHYHLDFIKLLYFIPLSLLIYFARQGETKFRLFMTISISTAFFVTFILLGAIAQRNRRQLSFQAKHLEYFRDYVAEQVLGDIEKKLQKDDLLASYLERSYNEDLGGKIYKYLKLEYFGGYLKKYNIKIKLCRDDDYQTCFQTYIHEIDKNGTRLSENLYFLNSPGRLPGYLILIRHQDVMLSIEFTPTLAGNRIGYPELLVDQSVKSKVNNNYKYAIYQNGRLIYKSGEFIYPSDEKFWQKFNNQHAFVSLNGYLHYLSYDKSRDYLIVVSVQKINLYDILITFSYLFFIFLFIGGIIFFIIEIGSVHEPLKITFRTRLLIFMLGILTGSFIIIGLTTVAINRANYRRKFEEKIKNNLTRTRLVLEKQYVSGDVDTSGQKLEYLVRNIADILNTDINLYDYSGRLIATSRQKIYENNLLAPYINYNALVNLLENRYIEYINTETIGNLKFTSTYTVINDNNRRVRGFINIPYFANSQEIRKEILDLLFTLGNIYIVMFLFTVLIAFVLSEQIIAPLKELQDKIKQLKVGHKYEKIDYHRGDEIGRLVEEYNNMVEKLEESVQLLAKSERESAWRDMAKQVAHEIKNPLTPMKLSIQLLQKSWENGDQDFGSRLNDVTRTLIEQIENLRNIAEEFSNFAKMPKSENEKIDLAQKIENIVKLYENLNNLEVKAIIKNRPVYIWADNKQISRSLINLIKNAIQAIPEGVKGLVIVELEKVEGKALIKITDNGTGIPDDVKHKLFTPSFTTKSSGMGLGLSMVKNIVQNAKGRIWFETELGKGTTFYIEFPVYKEDS